MAVLLYLILSFGFSWGVFAFFHAHGLFHHGVGVSETPILILYMCGPAIAALIFSIATRKSMPITKRLGLRIVPNCVVVARLVRAARSVLGGASA